jgi:predicted unusual protein kinase regulating ubiquinone biosynthesis (AarF/ABC1/UbiB family)
MKSIDKIPTSKIERASKIIATGAKVGRNYLKYYANRVTKSQKEAAEELNVDNAEDIYDGLKTMKGSALKVAQMMSMDQGMLPQAYVDKFSLSQFSVPPLSGPLITKTFRKYFKVNPADLYDSFDSSAINAASIGQVHLATKYGKKLAVKIQYPGVSESISSDLALIKPFALKLLNISGSDADVYFKEVKDKLLEETDYVTELKQGQKMAEGCSEIPNLLFPSYYPELSCEKVITMDFMEGLHLSEYCKEAKNQDELNSISQVLWDFYMFQIHVLKKVHADPHPGNFLVSKEEQLIALDFGCLKEIPISFYTPYFALTDQDVLNDKIEFRRILTELEVLRPSDSENEIVKFENVFRELLSVFTKPFQSKEFDFSDPEFFQELIDLGQRLSQDAELRKQNGGRGSKHFIYINRTFFGLYNLMFDLKGKQVKVDNYKKYS